MKFDRMAYCATALIGAATLYSSTALAQSGGLSPGFEDAAVFATNSARLSQGTTVTGDVVVNDEATGPTLNSSGLELRLEKNALVNGNLQSDSIRLDKNVEVGEVTCNDSDIDNNATTGTVNCDPGDLPLPVFLDIPEFQSVAIRPEAEDITLSQGETLVIPEAACEEVPVPLGTLCGEEFNDVDLDKDSTLIFRGGNLRLRSINTDKNSAILFLTPSEVRVEEQIDIDKDSTFGPAAQVEDANNQLGNDPELIGDGVCDPGENCVPGITARDMIVYLSGANGPNADDMDPGATPPAFRIDKNGVLDANIYAPFGTIRIDKDSAVTGALLARDVRIDQNTTVVLDSFFANRPPTADPQTVFTAGAISIDILLTGSDPEDGGLTFSIVGPPPSAGVLSGLTQIVPALIQVEDPNNAIGDNLLLIGNGACDSGELCTSVQPAITSAKVTYTPDDPDLNAADSFMFQVADNGGAVGVATVDINPGGDPTVAPPEVDIVIASDLIAATTAGVGVSGLPVVLTLTGDAPCDPINAPDPSQPCDGFGDDVPLTFSIVPLSGPDFGNLSGLTQGSGDPRRSATVTYTPIADFLGFDIFMFEACGSIGCDTATVTIDVLNARPVQALPQTVSVSENTGVPEEREVLGDGEGNENGVCDGTETVGNAQCFVADPAVSITLNAMPGGDGEETQ